MALLVFAGNVAAHGIVVESVPAAGAHLTHSPPRIMLRFNAVIEKSLSHVYLIGPTSVRRSLPLAIAAADDPARLVVAPPPLAAGAYQLRYKVLAADGHITEGVLRFSVDQSIARP